MPIVGIVRSGAWGNGNLTPSPPTPPHPISRQDVPAYVEAASLGLVEPQVCLILKRSKISVYEP